MLYTIYVRKSKRYCVWPTHLFMLVFERLILLLLVGALKIISSFDISQIKGSTLQQTWYAIWSLFHYFQQYAFRIFHEDISANADPHSCLADSDSSVFSKYDGVFFHLVVFVNSPFRLKRRCGPFQLTKQTLFFDEYLGIYTGLSCVLCLAQY